MTTPHTRTAPVAVRAAVPPPPLVSLIVPAYNEASLLDASLTTLWDHADTLARWRFEMIIVNDGSDDGTDVIADAFAARHTGVRAVHHRTNLNLGGALRTAIPMTAGDYVVTYDADLSYSVDHIERLLDELERTQADVVLASPYSPGGESIGVPPRLLLRSKAANRWLAATAQGDLHTLTGLVRAYDGDWIRGISLKAKDVDINVEIIYKAQITRSTIVEIPATLDWTPIGTRSTRSQIFSRRERWNVYQSLVNGFVFRPFLFPVVPGLLLLLTGALMFLLGSGMGKVTLFGAVCLVTGALLTWQALPLLQNKRYFEELYNERHIQSRRRSTRRPTDEARSDPPR